MGLTAQSSGTTPNDFTNAVAAVVTAEDATTVTQTVTVTFAAAPGAHAINLAQTGSTTAG